MQKSNELKIELNVNTTLLEDKLKLLSEFKSRLLEQGVQSVFLELFVLTLNESVNDRDIFLCDCRTATGTNKSFKLICVFDFDFANFIRKWLLAMRAFDRNGNCLFHNNSSNCRGD